MWVEKITLTNIKCFSEQTIAFTHDSVTGASATPYRWITFLGENGVGKTTLLQALALLLAGPEAAKELLPRPTGWVRDPSKPGKLSAAIHQEDGDGGVFGEKKARKVYSFSYSVTGNANVQIGQDVYTEPALIEDPSRALSWLRTNAFASRAAGWFAVGYGAFRRLTRTSQVIVPSLDPPLRATNFATQFNEDSPLSSFERWMVYLDYRIAKDPKDLRARQMRDAGKAAITRLLPGDVHIEEVSADGLIQFSVNGQKVPTINLSDGYRSVVALAGDLIWRLLQAFPDLADPTRAPGVVLIDELDIHLHPSWQRQIAGWLQDAFPNLQFFVATHSPLIAAGAGDDAYTLRLDLDEGAARLTEITDLSALDADRVLRSPAFDLPSTYAPQTQEKIDRYHYLRNNGMDSLEEQVCQFVRDAGVSGAPPKPGSLEARIDRYLEKALP